MKKVIPALSVLAMLVLGASLAFAMGLLNLPGYQVSATQVWLGAGGANGTVDITLSGVGSGFDVADGTYAGWCIEDNFRPNAPPGTLVTLFDSTDDAANLPASYQGIPWDKVNYLLNHNNGNVAEVQAALWVLTWGSSTTFPVDSDAQMMLDDAMANGSGFVPGPGQVVAVILQGDGLGFEGYQDTIIAVPVPPEGGEGCTPGYWKNHLEDWPATGFSPSDDFDATFGVDLFDPDITLEDAVNAKGGGVNKLARHGTAALLSAAHPDVNYPYTVGEVITLVQAGDVDPLVAANELGCQIP
jgi:hypothetical protein